MNADQVGHVMASNWNSFQNPVGFGLDASRFDQHVSRSALEWEHSVYNSVFASPELRRLLRWQLSNRGIGRTEGYRVDYSVEGCRMSGDINTGMGNCLLMSSMVLAYCEHKGINARLANNGDDCVVFCERGDLPRFGGLTDWFLDFGFTLTREAPCYHLEEVEFCQFQPVRLSTGWRMVRNPFKAMSKDCVSLVGWDKESEVRAWATAVGTCGIALTSGVPVWEAWYRRLVRLGDVVTPGLEERVRDCGAYHWSRGCTAAVVDDECRYSFYRAFGITPDQQVALEAEYDGPAELLPIRPVMCLSQACINDHDNSLSKLASTR
nr:MAG: RNA-dependent RNA polymerase [Owegonang virus 8]